MTPTDLIAAFESLAEAPDAVARLRQLILQLAVRGRLVRQDPKDEPAIILLERIAAEKARLIKAGEASKPKSLLPVSAADHPFALPAGWAFARLGEIAEIIRGVTYQKSQASDQPAAESVALLRAHNIQDGIAMEDLVYVPRGLVKQTQFLKNSDLLFCIASGSERLVGKSARVSALVDATFGAFTAVGRPVDPAMSRFLGAYTKSPTGHDLLIGMGRGIGINNLKTTDLAALVVPVPPLAEQHRIVARVEELMGLLDRLEAVRAKRETTRTAARDSVLAALREADSPAEVDAAWARFAQRMDDLLFDPADIVPLRQTVLELAVRGRLVRQDPNDEPAVVLLERIAAEKVRLIEKGQVPNQRLFDPASSVVAAFAPPAGWVWARMDDCFVVAGGIQKSGKRRPQGNAFPYLRVANVQRGSLDLRVMARFELFEGELERLRLLRGDLLVVEGNGSENEIGRCARWDGQIESCVYQNHIIRCRPIASGHEHFALLFLNSPCGMRVMKSLAVTTSGLYTLSVGKIRSIAMPVPPLGEQLRIVSRVDEMMALIDRMEQRLTSARSAHSAFAAAAAHHMLA
jgi:type I restriction enzyme, S subunit